MLKTSLLILALCLLLSAPCFAHGSFVYVTNYGDGTISQYRVRPNGTLTPLSPPTVKAHILCHSLAVAQGRYLYAISAHDWSVHDCLVSQFRIAPSGRLIALTPAQIRVPGTPATIAVAPYGRFTYVFNREGKVSQFRITSTGSLSPLSPQVISVANAGGITPIIGFDQPRHVLYGSYVVGMMDSVLGGTFALRIGREGQLKPLPGSGTLYNTWEQKVSPPDSVSLTPNGRYAYIMESIHDMRVVSQWRAVAAQYQTQPNGILKSLSPPTLDVEASGTSFIDPNGRFLYLIYEKTAESGVTAAYRLARARIHRNGSLGQFAYQMMGVPASLPPVQEFSLAFSPTGRFCYFVEGGYVYSYRRQADGSLSPLRPSRCWAGYGPLDVICVQR